MFFILYRDIKITFGAKRATLIDTRSDFIKIVPTEVAHFLAQTYIDKKKCSTEEIELLDYLVENEFGMYCTTLTEVTSFPKINTTFESPAQISNAIIEIGETTLSHLPQLLNQLSDLGCNYIEFRFLGEPRKKTITNVVSITGMSNIGTITLLVNHHKAIEIDFYENLKYAYNVMIEKVKLFSFVNTTTHELEALEIVSTTNKPLHSNHCGVIDQNNFVSNLIFYNESLAHNTCLNKKIGITANGEIKNCPSMQPSFGNIKTTALKDVIQDTNFNSKWAIKKADILVCKDCEFRNVCMDCRAFVTDPINDKSAPLKCGYDPYTNKWSDWAKNIKAKRGVEFYGL